MEILVIGGSRFVGPVLVKQLLSNGHHVTIFNRGQIQSEYPESVTFIRGDRNDGFSIKSHFDVVIDTCAYNGAHTKTALHDLSYDFFIHFGTVASYKKSEIFPLTEDSHSGDWPFMGEYNKGKVECELELEASGRKYASIRPDYILGPHNYLDREHFIYSRIHRGQPLVLPGNGQALCQFVFAQDVAAIMVMLAEGQITGAFNCSSDEAITLKGLTEYMAELVGKKPIIRYNPTADGENHDESEFPFANENLLCSNQKLKDLGFTFTPLLEGLKSDFNSYYKGLLKQ
jgi:nucleoside-diphosphate-sugar epimerase